MLGNQGWTISGGGRSPLQIRRSDGIIPSESISILHVLPAQYAIDLSNTQVADVSALKDLKSLTILNLRGTKVADISALKDLRSLRIWTEPQK